MWDVLIKYIFLFCKMQCSSLEFVEDMGISEKLMYNSYNSRNSNNLLSVFWVSGYWPHKISFVPYSNFKKCILFMPILQMGNLRLMTLHYTVISAIYLFILARFLGDLLKQNLGLVSWGKHKIVET